MNEDWKRRHRRGWFQRFREGATVTISGLCAGSVALIAVLLYFAVFGEDAGRWPSLESYLSFPDVPPRWREYAPDWTHV